ncbi:hypothetical protein [Rhizobium sp. LCM 4573]|uniref:hypothetical protein n=1 Tax=Rhizobium sp. LCM 4573 TaxID=1848291 RepID=UPI0008DB1EB9|nr:hypothetical protein [Rhizobium sp. LCM 4573]OHV76315.1 hypothetical protein LCM4573_11805 [Rhizobium sp. LCM 4573]
MPDIKTPKLIVLVLILSLATLVPGWMRLTSETPPGWIFTAGLIAFLLNIVIAILGLRTPQKWWWAIYLAASIVIFILAGFSTPLSALLTLPRTFL